MPATRQLIPTPRSSASALNLTWTPVTGLGVCRLVAIQAEASAAISPGPLRSARLVGEDDGLNTVAEAEFLKAAGDVPPWPLSAAAP